MAGNIVENVHPTRMELLKIKKRTKLAVKGHRLLKEKRDALVVEFFGIVNKAKGIADSVAYSLTGARTSLVVAQGLEGISSVSSIALSTQREIDVGLHFRNVMGVKIPEVSTQNIIRSSGDRGYQEEFVSPSVEIASSDFEQVLDKSLDLSEIQGSLTALAGEIKKTKRRVNALEHILIPKLENTQKHIQFRLEELERENFIRLKKIKSKKW